MRRLGVLVLFLLFLSVPVQAEVNFGAVCAPEETTRTVTFNLSLNQEVPEFIILWADDFLSGSTLEAEVGETVQVISSIPTKFACPPKDSIPITLQLTIQPYHAPGKYESTLNLVLEDDSVISIPLLVEVKPWVSLQENGAQFRLVSDYGRGQYLLSDFSNILEIASNTQWELYVWADLTEQDLGKVELQANPSANYQSLFVSFKPVLSSPVVVVVGTQTAIKADSRPLEVPVALRLSGFTKLPAGPWERSIHFEIKTISER